ncbi:MAG: molybdate ABC transporter permease subunit [Tildeniella nuda ZEHNDER 1965/U140]|jgi:molybdate transport system permease protein|nr:molybdate ABC transporter permease subunit [Tildeniella nuda ZEHNDER 1965/U140]
MPSDLSPLWISLKTALLATVVTFFVGIAVAYWMLHYRGKGKFLLEGLLISPLLLPPTVIGFLLLLLFGKNGVAGQVLQPFGFSVVFTWYGAVLAATVVAFPLMYKTTLGAFEQVDGSLLAVARTLGASEWRVFRRLLLPLALPGIVAGTMLAFARALGEFGATLMLAGNIPGQTQTMPMAIYFAVEAGAIEEAWFWAIAIMSLSLSGIFVVNRWQQSGSRRQEAEGRRQEVEGSGQRSAVSGQRSGSTRNHSSPPPPLPPSPSYPILSKGLSVDIQTQLSGFQLSIAFDIAASTLGTSTLGILGSSGAGKSLLLRCLAGLETPTKGRIVLNGRVLFDSSQGINVPSCDRRIGFLAQNYALFPHMTVAQNIAFGLPKGLPVAEKRQWVEAQLMTVKLVGLGDRYPQQLSGGQQQRVALARALANQPEALLLDEPFSALDTALRSQMEQEMIERLSHFDGVSLLVTHNLEEAYRVCEDLLVLEAGVAIAHGSKQDVFEHPTTSGVAQLTGCQNISHAVAVSPNTIEATDWGVHLQVMEPLPDRLTHVGIRAQQLSFTHDRTTHDRTQPNTVPCWLVSTSETPNRITLLLKFHAPPAHTQDYHVQAELSKNAWAALKECPRPWLVQLAPSRLLLMPATTPVLES